MLSVMLLMGGSALYVGQEPRMNHTPILGHIGAGRGSASRPTRRRRTAGALSSEAVWGYLCAYMVEHTGRPPAVREIAKGLGGCSLGSVSKALSQLQVQGKIRYRYGTRRNIEIVGATFLLPAGSTGEIDDHKSN